MVFATTIPRYDKNQPLIIDERETTLINHLKELRTQKKITKKRISNLIKHNDYWYSQVERDGKNGDDNRQRTIYRSDLVDIISILCFDATTSSDLESLKEKSENYLDKVIKALPLGNSARKLDWYQLYQGRSPEAQNQLFESLLATHEKLLHQTFHSLSGAGDRDLFLNAFKNINLTLKIDPLFLIFLSGMPFANFLYDSKQEKINSLLRDIMNLLDAFTISANKVDGTKEITDYISTLQSEIIKYTNKSFMDQLNEKYNFLERPIKR